jgi:hypothetical protein
MADTVRCPYCVLGLEFLPMIAHVEGRYICWKCGHTAKGAVMRNVPAIRPPVSAFNETNSQQEPADLENRKIVAMDWPMIERVRDLQREIALIEQETRTYLACCKPGSEKRHLQRWRVARLTEIKNELGHLRRSAA